MRGRLTRGRVLVAVLVVVLLAWQADERWTSWRADRHVSVGGTLQAEFVSDAEWAAIDPQVAMERWVSGGKSTDGPARVRAIVLRIRLHADHYPQQCWWQVMFAHPAFPDWAMLSAGPMTGWGSAALPVVNIGSTSEEMDFLQNHPELVSPLETQEQRLNDFGLQITDPNATYLTAIAAVPVGATGDVAGIRAWVRPTCGAHPAFSELTRG